MFCASKGLLRSSAALSLMLSLTFGAVSMPNIAYALSELKQVPGSEQGEKPAEQPQASQPEEIEGDSDGIPMPDPLVDRSGAAKPAEAATQDAPPLSAEIQHDVTKAPAAVQRLRQLVMEAAATGDIEKLRPLVNPGPNQARVDGDGEDPIAALKSFSGDPDGLEVLAIILDLLSTGYAHVDAGTPDEMYIWPYFAGKQLSKLTAPEKVELLRIITAGDLADMQEYGNYSFYRIGISPDGQWKFFTAGD